MSHPCCFQADAQMLSELMLLQDILIASNRDRSSPVHVVAVVRCNETVKVSHLKGPLTGPSACVTC